MISFREKSSPSLPRLSLVFILLLSFSLMLWASAGDSAITDELAHIPAGYGYIRHLDYRLNPEHPPLVKALAALPLLFLNLNFPTADSSWTTDVNGQWAMGAKFLYESGNDADRIIGIARIGPMLLTLLLILLVYIWSAELLGRNWALLPTFLVGLSPTILAHGHYVTTDIGATLGTVAATYFFLKFIFLPSRRHLLYSGLAFGAAQLMKFSAALLIPYFLALIFFFFISTILRDWIQTDPQARLKRFSVRAWRYFRSVIIVYSIGYLLIVYPIYFLFTVNEPQQKQTTDTEFILTSFAGGPTPPGHFCNPVRCLADLDIWMTKHAGTRPFAEYLLGILMVVQRSSGGNTSYFLGQVSATGSPYYFPTVYLLKESLPALIMILVALLFGAAAIVKKIGDLGSGIVSYFFTDYLPLHFATFSMLVFILLYWAYSIRSPLNIGVRHLLPTLPFIYILAASTWKRWLETNGFAQFEFRLEWLHSFLKFVISLLLKRVFLFGLMAWLFLETVFSAPYFLSYFNELGGGTKGGYRLVTDSNYDWGQDLLRLKQFVDTHPEIDKIAVDYFGGGSPNYYLGAASTPLGTGKEIDWQSSKGNPSQTQNDTDNTQTNADNFPRESASSPRKSAIKWLAVSINTLESATQKLAPGQKRKPEDEYRWLTTLRPPQPGIGTVPEPDYRAGTSIFIYKLY